MGKEKASDLYELYMRMFMLYLLLISFYYHWRIVAVICATQFTPFYPHYESEKSWCGSIGMHEFIIILREKAKEDKPYKNLVCGTLTSMDTGTVK
uniref:Uncharacterized protein n=1 Tax=Cucumis melo TaxID=3656 RepID=A0A9I9EGP6_CUCME